MSFPPGMGAYAADYAFGSSALRQLLTLAVLAIRYGHVRFPYREDESQALARKRYVRE